MSDHFNAIPRAERERIVKYVCDELAKGKRSLGSIIEQDRELEDLCSYGTLNRWQNEDDEVRKDIVRARETGIERSLEEIVEIADDKTEDANSRKVRIYAREKRAQMLQPKKYGQRIDVTSAGEKLEGPKTLVVEAKINSLLTQIMGRSAQSDELIEGSATELDAETRKLLE